MTELSSERVGELQRFCWQYREKLARITARRNGAGTKWAEGGRGKGGISRPTERSALYALDSRDARDIEMIETAAREAAEGSEVLYACLIANVCDRVSCKQLYIPQGINQFTATRKKFFCLLDAKR